MFVHIRTDVLRPRQVLEGHAHHLVVLEGRAACGCAVARCWCNGSAIGVRTQVSGYAMTAAWALCTLRVYGMHGH